MNVVKERQNSIGTNNLEVTGKSETDHIAPKSTADQNIEETKPVVQEQFSLKERKGFYETLFAKIITVFFILLSIGLIYLFIIGTLGKATHIFRLFIIIIPGTIYMAYRVFGKKKTNEES